MLHQIKAQQFYTHFLVLISPLSQSSIFVFFISLLSLKTMGESFRSPWNVLEFYSNLPVWTLKKLLFKGSHKGTPNVRLRWLFGIQTPAIDSQYPGIHSRSEAPPWKFQSWVYSRPGLQIARPLLRPFSQFLKLVSPNSCHFLGATYIASPLRWLHKPLFESLELGFRACLDFLGSLETLFRAVSCD